METMTMIPKDGIERRVLSILVASKDTYDVLKAVTEYVVQCQRESAGEQASENHDVLRRLSDSINNAGWEERHSDQITMINEAKYKIAEEFEDFLP